MKKKKKLSLGKKISLGFIIVCGILALGYGIYSEFSCKVSKCKGDICVGDKVVIIDGVYASNVGIVTDLNSYYWVTFCDGKEKLFDKDEILVINKKRCACKG